MTVVSPARRPRLPYFDASLEAQGKVDLSGAERILAEIETFDHADPAFVAVLAERGDN
jgi:hypothetical protein